jgi:hypothetical protein
MALRMGPSLLTSSGAAVELESDVVVEVEEVDLGFMGPLYSEILSARMHRATSEVRNWVRLGNLCIALSL